NFSLSCEFLRAEEVRKPPRLRPTLPARALVDAVAAAGGPAAGAAVVVGFRPDDWLPPDGPRGCAPGPAPVPDSGRTGRPRRNFPAPTIRWRIRRPGRSHRPPTPVRTAK